MCMFQNIIASITDQVTLKWVYSWQLRKIIIKVIIHPVNRTALGNLVTSSFLYYLSEIAFWLECSKISKELKLLDM